MRRADPAAALLAECLLATAGPRPTLRALAKQALGRRFVALARELAVSETASHVLMGADLLDALGPAAAAALRADGERATAFNALLVAEAAAVQRALAEAGVESVALKGVALVALHYPAIGARHVEDLDLLVHPSRTERAADVLRGLGCVPCFGPRLDYEGRPIPVVRSGDHLPPLRTPRGVVLELHDAVPGVPGRRADAADVLGRARLAPWRGTSLRVPAPEDLLGIACTHVLGKHRDDPRFLPRHLADVAVLLAAGADPARAERLHPGPEVAESTALVAAASAGSVAALRVARRGAFAAAAARGRSLFAATRGARQRGVLSRLLFPTRTFLAARYRVSPSSPWLPLLWAWRPLRAALRVVSGR